MYPQTDISKTWFVLVNPVAGFARGLEDLPLITKLIRENEIPYELVFSQHKHHVTELTVQAVKDGYRHIMVIGGDGTLHEVVNGLFIQQTVEPSEVTIGVVAVGTGNDWIRMYGLPKTYSEAIRAIKEGYTFLQDIGEVHYEQSQFRQVRYMANVSGVGFDPSVTKIYEHYKALGKRGKHLYAQGCVKSFLSYKSTGVKVWVDARLEDGKMMYSADSDAIITKGIIALLIRVMNGRSPQEIVDLDLYFIDAIGLGENLSPTRSNGLVAMIKQMKMYALALNSRQA